MTQIHSLFGVTPEQYADEVFETYFHWCQKYGATDQHVQQLLANASVCKWFMREYAKIERAVLEHCEPYNGQIAVAAVKEFYYKQRVEVFKWYPCALVDAIMKDTKTKDLITQN